MNGRREAHCTDETSPYWKSGYNIEYAGRWADRNWTASVYLWRPSPRRINCLCCDFTRDTKSALSRPFQDGGRSMAQPSTRARGRRCCSAFAVWSISCDSNTFGRVASSLARRLKPCCLHLGSLSRRALATSKTRLFFGECSTIH